ncbi:MULTISPECIES: ROK family transcriptional regulator [Streptomyces]|uniref:ROK family transcriptional regulator n=1 Tax=Streptomyces cylindrosporus TaxID=2927583 RepID=A0ABS9Y0D6_9ACTN|nr:ROK family transcriptional regulator [Streptomyces cylindrosporus]MCI3270688.1 ROK family transcriptional regulator [Streptomyces cylindrosporus]
MNSPADSAAVRRGNLSLVLRHIAAHGPCARTEIAAATGLVHATVTALVADLMTRGLVEEVGVTASGSRGRPRRLLHLVAERVRIVAAHVTWGDIRLVTAGVTGELIDAGRARHPGPFGPPEPMADAIATAVTEAVSPGPDVHLGRLVIAMSGPVTSGRAKAPTEGVGWHAPTLGALVAERLPGLSCPVEVVNDADLAALAEYHALRLPGTEGPSTVAYVKSDSGVGGGLLINGRIHQGSHGLGGEVAHLPVSLDGPRCRCGAHGCLTAYVSTHAVLESAGLGRESVPEGIDAALAELGRRLRAGEPRALATLDQAGHALGAAIQSIVGLTDAEEIILGGHLTDWIPWLTPGIDTRLAARRRAFPTLPIAVTPGVLGARAALHGAVQTGRDRVLADPAEVPPCRARPSQAHPV